MNYASKCDNFKAVHGSDYLSQKSVIGYHRLLSEQTAIDRYFALAGKM